MPSLYAVADDLTKLNDGAWVTWRDGIRFRVRPNSFGPFEEALATLLQELPKESEEQIRAHKAVFCTHLVTDWENVDHHETNQPFVYDPTYLSEMLMRPELESLWRLLNRASVTERRYRREKVEEAVEKVEPISSGG